MPPRDKNGTLQIGAGENIFLKQDLFCATRCNVKRSMGLNCLSDVAVGEKVSRKVQRSKKVNCSFMVLIATWLYSMVL